MTNWHICTWWRPADISGKHPESEGFSVYFGVDGVFPVTLTDNESLPDMSRSQTPAFGAHEQ